MQFNLHHNAVILALWLWSLALQLHASMVYGSACASLAVVLALQLWLRLLNFALQYYAAQLESCTSPAVELALQLLFQYIA